MCLVFYVALLRVGHLGKFPGRCSLCLCFKHKGVKVEGRQRLDYTGPHRTGTGTQALFLEKGESMKEVEECVQIYNVRLLWMLCEEQI